jgi:putative transposase
MLKFSRTKTLQKFVAAHSQIHNYFNWERHLVSREIYKQRRLDALAEWRAIAAQTEVRLGLVALGGGRLGLT